MHTFIWSSVLRRQCCCFKHRCHTFKAQVAELHMKMWPTAVSPWSATKQADNNPKQQAPLTMFFAETKVLQYTGTREPQVTLPMAIHHVLISSSVWCECLLYLQPIVLLGAYIKHCLSDLNPHQAWELGKPEQHRRWIKCFAVFTYTWTSLNCQPAAAGLTYL